MGRRAHTSIDRDQLAGVDLGGVQPLGDLLVDSGADFDPFAPVDPLEEPAPEGTVLAAEFSTIGVTFATGMKGMLRLTMLTERHEKMAAMPVTDYPGQRLLVRVYRHLTPDELDEYEDDGGQEEA